MPRRSPPHPLTEALAAALRAEMRPGEGVLLAVSGGADSTALLELAAPLRESLKLTLEVATIDHGLRPEAAEDVKAVLAHAARWSLPAQVRALRLAPGPGIEARARVAREAALEEVRRERGLQWIATAHTADDQAETVLMRLGRGAGLRGAVGILPKKGRLLRPLLGISRAQLRRFLSERGVPWREDPMNQEPAFLRVRVRHRLLPALADACGEAAALQLAGFAGRAAQDHAALDAMAMDAWRRLSLPAGGLDAVGLRALLPAIRARVLSGLLADHGARVDHRAVADAEEALLRGGRCAVSRTLTFHAEGGQVRIVRASPLATAGTFTLEPGAAVFDPPSGLELRVQPDAPPDAWSLPVPADAFPLTVRRRQRGEQLVWRGQRRRLQDLLVNARVPVERRDRLPIIVSASGEALAVAGVWPARSEGQEKWRLVAMPQSNPSDRAGTGL